MPKDTVESNLEGVLQEALSRAELLKKRIEAGEDIDETEIQAIARLIATQMEEARSMLEKVVGPVDHEQLKANLKAKLSPREYEEWLAAEEERRKFQSEFGQPTFDQTGSKEPQ
jgi:phytoene/squalene synthetase